MPVSRDVIIIGAGGHAKVIADIVLKCNDNLLGFLDDNKPKNDIVLGYPILGKVDDILSYANKAVFIIGIGDNYIRKSISGKYNVTWHTAIHPSAIIGVDAAFGEGTVVMANAVINVSAKIGRHCIINTGAIVEHDNLISDYAHISPNAALGGMVNIGECTHIGIGASVKNNITVAADCVVGADAAVVKDIAESGVYVGVPARRMDLK